MTVEQATGGRPITYQDERNPLADQSRKKTSAKVRRSERMRPGWLQKVMFDVSQTRDARAKLVATTDVELI